MTGVTGSSGRSGHKAPPFKPPTWQKLPPKPKATKGLKPTPRQEKEYVQKYVEASAHLVWVHHEASGEYRSHYVPNKIPAAQLKDSSQGPKNIWAWDDELDAYVCTICRAIPEEERHRAFRLPTFSLKVR